MPKPVDLKFQFLATHVITGQTHSQDDGIVFLAKDDAFPGTLQAYLQECQRLGAKKEQLEGVKRLIKRVEAWRAAHPDLCKVPDVEPGPEADRVLAD
jgi:hypothetical protein